MTGQVQVVKCKGCGKDRWWVSEEFSPPLCTACTAQIPQPVSDNAKQNKKLKRWVHAKDGFIEAISIEGQTIYFRKTKNNFVTELCLGERYAHSAPGLYFYQEEYRGCYSDNWHGGPSTGSLLEIARWVREADHPEYGYDLWMKGTVYRGLRY